MPESFQLTPEAQRVLTLRAAGRNALVLGDAGAGKGLLLQRLRETAMARTQVAAPAGLAAAD